VYVILHSAPGAGVEVEIGRVEYDVEAAAQAIVAVGLPPELADMIRSGH
jgi:hypothetical protein